MENDKDPSSARYLFFGGKGGVGKTTAASATALFPDSSSFVIEVGGDEGEFDESREKR